MARSYALLEKCTFGNALSRCRLAFLGRLSTACSGLVFGDGDGRFIAELLATNTQARVVSVDSSAEMLRLQKTRAQTNRLTVVQADAREYTPSDSYDLVVTHFFLDCLTQEDADGLIDRVTPHLQADATWVLSEFAVPQRGVSRFFGKALIAALYLGFRILTGLRVTKIPDHSRALSAAGFTRTESQTRLYGILRSELWRRTRV